MGVWSASCVPALVTGSHPACCTPSTCRHGRAGLQLSACSLSALSWPLPPPSPPRGPQVALARLGTPHSPHLQQARARHQLAASLARPGSGQGLSPQPAGGSWEPGPGCLGGLLQLLSGGLFALQRTRMPAALRALSWTPKERSVRVSRSLSPEGGRGPGSHAPRSLPTSRALPQPLPPRLPHCTRPLLRPAQPALPWPGITGTGEVSGPCGRALGPEHWPGHRTWGQPVPEGSNTLSPGSLPDVRVQTGEVVTHTCHLRSRLHPD